ncbi:MAG TPA: response regulator [Gemmataceae bacterium]|jgi:two-component system chemotaxis response regulator CheY|nr:response regulator [Gemmataceae bacterium]
MSDKRVLSVGQCFADHSAISRTFQRHFAAEVVHADSASEAIERLRKENFDLVLVNRVLDADGSDGLNLVKQIKAEEPPRDIPVMLVSNYEDSQRQAVELGALPGFGKAALGQPAMVARLKAALNGPTEA